MEGDVDAGGALCAEAAGAVARAAAATVSWRSQSVFAAAELDHPWFTGSRQPSDCPTDEQPPFVLDRGQSDVRLPIGNR
jgi:hypothetical protein